MKYFNALPTEQRVKELNNAQYIWLYLNILEDKKQQIQERNDVLDYLKYFMNFDLAKAVDEQKKKNEKSTSKYEERNVSNANEIYNDSFDAEIAKYLDNEKFVELPSSDYKYSTESKEEFIERALAFEQFLNSEQFNNSMFDDRLINNQNINNQNNNKEIIDKENIENNKINVKNNKGIINKNNKEDFNKEEFNKQLQKDIDDGLDIFIIPEDE